MVQLPEVAAAVLALAKRFNVALVAADVWQAQLLLQLLQQEGLPTLPVQFSQTTLPAMAQEVLGAFNDRRIELFDDADLLADLARLRIVEKSYGLRLESPRDGRGHGDIASALSVALLAAKSIASAPGPPRIDRELVIWPR
jgi:phage terminase large subunit-like protein